MNPFSIPFEGKWWRPGFGVLVAAGILVAWHLFSLGGISLPYPSLIYLSAIVLSSFIGGLIAGLIGAALCLADLFQFLHLLDAGTSPATWERFALNAALLPIMALVVGLLKQRQTREAVKARRQHARLVDAIESIEDAFALFDAENRLVICNARYRSYFPLAAHSMVSGASFEEIARVTAYSGQIAGIAGREEEWITQRLATHRIESKIQIIETSDGRRLRLASRITGEGGRVGICTDITGLTERERKFEASQVLLRTVFDTLPVTLVVKDAETRYLMVNKAWCARYGATPDQVIGKRSLDIPGRTEADKQYTLEQDRETLAGNRNLYMFEGWDTTATGQPRHYQSIRAPIRDESGKATGLVNVTVDLTELKRAEEEVRASQRLLRSLFDSIPHDVWMKDREGRYVTVNKKLAETFGVPAEQILGRRTATDASEAELKVILESDRAVIESGLPREAIQERHVREVVRQFRTIKTPFRNDAGDVIGLVGIAEDITERLAAERDLRENRLLLQTVFETIPHGLVVKDMAGRYVMVNKAWCETYGIAAKDAIGKSLLEISGRPETERAEFFREDQFVVSGEGRTHVVEQIHTVKGGETRFRKAIKSPLRDEGGRVVGMVGVYVDLTAEREARRNADTAHARLIDAIESLPAGFFLYDSEERLVLWNSRVRDLFPNLYANLRPGMFFEEVLRGATDSVAAAEGRPETWVRERLSQFRANPGGFEQQLADGRWLQGLDRRTSDGGTVCLRFDITEAKTREQELRQAQKMEAVGQLTGGVAHDFNNLLQVISGYTELALRDLDPASPIHPALTMITEASSRATDLTHQLLAFSRKRVMSPRELDLNEVVRGMAKLLSRLLPDSITLQVRQEVPLEPTVADAGMIDQVLMNLGVNARDAMPDGGQIQVETGMATLDETFCQTHAWAQPGRYITLRFTDTGCGMTPEVLERAFEPFFTTKGVGKGTGLGLSTVYGVVQQHQGLIHVASVPNQGTTVWIYLPVRRMNRLEIETSLSEPAPGGTETVLVVEDQEILRGLMVAGLQRAGYHVLTAANGESALGTYAQQSDQISLVVLDMAMPMLGGRECFLRMRQMSPKVRAIFSSGWFSPEEQQFLAKERQITLSKPFSVEQLLRAVRDALDREHPSG